MVAKRVKRKPKKIFIILLLTLFIIIAGGVYFIFFNHNQVKDTKVVSKIPEYGYTLKSNKSTTYKKLFQELKSILEKEKVNEKEYAKIITKMFITDFFSLNDHVAKTDVGGTDFIYTTALENFLVNAEDTLYKYVESNIYKQRNQKLPVVESITINQVKTIEYTYEEEIDEKAYQVIANWTYKDKEAADGYQTEAVFTYIHEGKKLALVEVSDKEADEEENQDE
ncbi:MAG: hypothetical protein HFJ12_00860 [Bacilli bacterium]|nr:hypothetical protein [Bacilli bacterium]